MEGLAFVKPIIFVQCLRKNKCINYKYAVTLYSKCVASKILNISFNPPVPTSLMLLQSLRKTRALNAQILTEMVL